MANPRNSFVIDLLQQARQQSARSINAIMTATHRDIGRRIVEREQQGKALTGYGEALVERLAADLTARFGKGFPQTNLKQMRQFFSPGRILRHCLINRQQTNRAFGTRYTLSWTPELIAMVIGRLPSHSIQEAEPVGSRSCNCAM